MVSECSRPLMLKPCEAVVMAANLWLRPTYAGKQYMGGHKVKRS